MRPVIRRLDQLIHGFYATQAEMWAITEEVRLERARKQDPTP
jgi:hypothetical protein